MLNEWNDDVCQECWFNQLLKKKILKPFILQWEHAAQRKCLNPIEKKTTLLGNQPLSPSSSVLNRGYNSTMATLLWQQHTKKQNQEGGSSPKANWTKPPHKYQHPNAATKSGFKINQGVQLSKERPLWHAGYNANLSEGKKHITELLSFFPLLSYTLHTSWTIFLHCWNTKPHASWA